jgi:hypothetical protein
VEYYFNKIYQFLHQSFGLGGSGGGYMDGAQVSGEVAGSASSHTLSYYFHLFAGFLTDILYIFLLIFITIIAYVIIRMFEVRKKEHEHLHHEIMEYAHKHHEAEEQKTQGSHEASSKPKNERWENILKHLYSEAPADWKLAIIDADEMLLTLMTDMGFKGDGLGEKLKSADRDEFHNLSTAWEVHTIRNRIAHEGLAYEMPHREAKRVIALYEQIFREFGYV